MQEPTPTPATPDAAHSRFAADAIAFAKATQQGLRADDPRLQGTVQLACRDGMNLTLPHAFTLAAGDWIYVFSKDHGYFVEHKDAVAKCSTSGQRGGRAA